jgi:hypothetical protein
MGEKGSKLLHARTRLKLFVLTNSLRCLYVSWLYVDLTRGLADAIFCRSRLAKKNHKEPKGETS